MPPIAIGEFDVQLTPDPASPPPVGRMLISKRFHGDLAGTSTGQMLAVRTPIKNSAGYVAMENVTATLTGKQGSFMLQHSGTMNRGADTLRVSVIPDSATGELAGLSGEMSINIEGGKHFYRFEYSLPET